MAKKCIPVSLQSRGSQSVTPQGQDHFITVNTYLPPLLSALVGPEDRGARLLTLQARQWTALVSQDMQSKWGPHWTSAVSGKHLSKTLDTDS